MLYFSYFVKLLLELSLEKPRQNHLSHNGPLTSSFILKRHWGHHSQSEPSFQTNMHEREPEFWQDRLGAVSRPELSCLLAGRHVCSCKSHQIRNHRTGEQPVESHSSTAGLTLRCVIWIRREYGGSLLQQLCCNYSKFLLKPKKMLFKKIQTDRANG